MKSTESRLIFLCIAQAKMNDNHARAKRPLQFLAKIERAVKLEKRVCIVKVLKKCNRMIIGLRIRISLLVGYGW